MDDIEENCLKMHILYLRRHKLMPEDFSKRITIKDFIYANFYYPIVMYWIITYIHLYKSFADPSQDLSTDILVLLTLTFDMYVFVVYYSELNQVLSFLNDLKCFTKFGRPRNLSELVARQNRNMKIMYISTVFSIFVYAFYSYFADEQCEKKVLREGTKQPCPLMLPLWLPHDLLSNYRVRLLIFVFQTLFAICWLLPTIAATYCIASITELITVRVVHLKEMLLEISKEHSPETRKKKLFNCIKYHIDIVRLVNGASAWFGKLNSAHFFLSSVVLGLLYYRILKILLLKDVLQVIGWLFCIAILCYTGQQLINESESLANDVYDLDWPNMDRHSKDCIRLVMWRMQTPLKVQAGIFYSYSNEFLLRITQGSYTYVTVLNTLFTKRNT